MSIMQYNGGAVVGMTGKNCVAIAADTRLGAQAQAVAFDFQKVFKMSDKVFLGLGGLATDVQTLYELMSFKLNMYKLREERDITPMTFAALLKNTLYEKRFGPYFAEPVIVGLDADNNPFIQSMDLIGAASESTDFAVAGTCTSNLNGMCESMYRPDLEPDDLFEVISQCLLASIDRDALSGYGAVVHVITPEGVTSRQIKTRND